MKKFILTFVTVMAFIPAAYAETVVDVKGMVCDFCAQALEKVFGEKEQVSGIEVDLNTQTVKVHYKEGMDPLSDEEIEKMIYWAGYDVVEIHH